ISNKGSDYLSQTHLIVRDVNRGSSQVIASGVRQAISWSPDGTKLAYANKSARSKGGSHFFDIYIYDFNRKKTSRVTRALRAHSPDWSPDATKLVCVVARDGTKNVGVFDLEKNDFHELTSFQNGEQVYHPRWSPDGKTILFAMSETNGQDLYLLDVTTKKRTPFLQDPFDARDAVFSPDGRKVCFSWDKTGIFNLYSKDRVTGEIEQLTNVVGGAFMPSVNANGGFVFSNFTADGYKISLLEKPLPIDQSKARYLSLKKEAIKFASVENSVPESFVEEIGIKKFDDSEVPDFEIKPYKSRYSPVSFLPRVMIDYGTVKLGSYFYSSDILSKYGFLAGVAVNKRFDYDLFALIDYRGFGPTLFLEAYNQVQHTKTRLTDPDELILRGVDSATDRFKFNLAEVDAGVRFKMNDTNTLRTAFVFSRYGARVKLQDFTGITTINYTYFIGRDFSFKFSHNNLKPSVTSDISPQGRTFTIGYDREFNKFLRDFATDRATSIEIFDNYNYNKFTFEWNEYRGLPLKDHTLDFNIQGGFIDAKVDSFFNFFGGGLLGNRGYPYFSIEGRKMLLGRVTYRFPLFRHLNLRILNMYFDKVFLGFFYDYGNAFDEDKLDLQEFKSSVGFQIRADTFSFYSFPTRIFFNGAYGLDEFRFANQTYGKEWRFYFGISFGYLD
ncbi:MAG: hypothetical protein ACE5G1_15315, partial [bacterium]